MSYADDQLEYLEQQRQKAQSTPDAPLTDSPAYKPVTDDTLAALIADHTDDDVCRGACINAYALMELRERRARDQAAAHDTRLAELEVSYDAVARLLEEGTEIVRNLAQERGALIRLLRQGATFLRRDLLLAYGAEEVTQDMTTWAANVGVVVQRYGADSAEAAAPGGPR